MLTAGCCGAGTAATAGALAGGAADAGWVDAGWTGAALVVACGVVLALVVELAGPEVWGAALASIAACRDLTLAGSMLLAILSVIDLTCWA